MLLCAAFPGPIRLALAAITLRIMLRCTAGSRARRRYVTLVGDAGGSWGLVERSELGGLQLRRCSRVAWIGWQLEFLTATGRIWVYVSTRGLDRRSRRLLARFATAGRT